MFAIKVRKHHPALIAVWAALIAASAFLPTFPVFGTGGNFSVGMALAPLAGIFFGPFAGVLAVAIGEVISAMIAPHTAPLGLLMPLINMTNAFAAGYLVRGRWQICLGIIIIGTLIWLTHPIPRQVPVFLLVYLSGMIMAPIGGIIGLKLFNNPKTVIKTAGLFLMAYPCYIAGSTVANYITILMFDLPVDLWRFLTWMIPFERTVFSIGAAIIGVPLIVALPKIGIFVGPEFDKEEEDDRDD
ncbi:MAG: hypothetical protein KGZ94_09940 [Clostridia bacterium]|nr:hypothetical protein [Clostridia bacterium]